MLRAPWNSNQKCPILRLGGLYRSFKKEYFLKKVAKSTTATKNKTYQNLQKKFCKGEDETQATPRGDQSPSGWQS